MFFLKYNVREGIVMQLNPIFPGTFISYVHEIFTPTESIIIIKNFGIQLRARYLFGDEKTEFFDNDRISSVFIHEYFYGSQVRYSLAFIVSGQERMSLLFKHIYPGFENLKRVYHTCKQNF